MRKLLGLCSALAMMVCCQSTVIAKAPGESSTGAIDPARLPIPASDGKLCGFVDRRGKFVIAPKFSDAQPFNRSGVALVYAPGFEKTDFIDTNGKIIFSSPKGVFAQSYNDDYTDDYILVRVPNFMGFIDKTGTIVIPAIWDEAKNFNRHKLAPVKKNGKWGFIDRKGNVAIALQFTYAVSFEGGKAFVRRNVGQEASFAYVTEDGSFLPYDDKPSQTRFDVAIGEQFGAPIFGSSGFGAAAFRTEKNKTRFALVFKDGTKITEPLYDQLSMVGDGQRFVIEIDKKSGVIDQRGNVVIAVKFDLIYSFFGTSTVIAKRDGKYGFINQQGKWINDRRFTQLGFCGPPPTVRQER